MSGESTDLPPIPITVRQLEAIIRIAESLARMSLQTIATGMHWESGGGCVMTLCVGGVV